MTETSNTPQIEKNEDEIDLIALAKKLWAGRRIILISTGIGLLIGIFVAIFSPKEYSVSTVMVPQVGSKNSVGGLSSLAALAGIDIGTSLQTGDISPILYPQIVSSTPFKLELMNAKYNFEDISQPISLYEFYTDKKYQKTNLLSILKKYTIGLPYLLIETLKSDLTDKMYSVKLNDNILKLSKKQDKVCKILDKNISLDVDAKQGYITLTANMPEALVTAQVAQKAQEILQREIIRFKVQKAEADYAFILDRYNELKYKAEDYQMSIAVNTDKYKNLISSVPHVQTTRIQTQYGVANTVYQELAKQLEQAKIQVKKDTPTFTVVKPVTIPLEKTKPNKPILVMIFTFLGIIVGTGVVFGKHILAGLKKRWKDEELTTVNVL